MQMSVPFKKSLIIDNFLNGFSKRCHGIVKFFKTVNEYFQIKKIKIIKEHTILYQFSGL